MDIWHISAFVAGFGFGYLNRFSIETIRGILFGAPRQKPLRLVPYNAADALNMARQVINEYFDAKGRR